MSKKEKIEIDFDFAPKGVAIIRQIVREELIKVFAERDARRDFIVEAFTQALDTNKDGIRDKLHKALGTRGI